MVRTDIQNAQQVLYDFFLYSVQTEPVDVVLAIFRRLFVDYIESSTESDLPVALYSIVIANSEQQFLFTLKRVCYILINNWGIQRRPELSCRAIPDPDNQSPNLRFGLWQTRSRRAETPPHSHP